MAHSCSSSHHHANKVNIFSCLNKEASSPGYCVFGQADSGWLWATTLIHCLCISLLALHQCEYGQSSGLICKHCWWNTQCCVTTCLSAFVCINKGWPLIGRWGCMSMSSQYYYLCSFIPTKMSICPIAQNFVLTFQVRFSLIKKVFIS